MAETEQQRKDREHEEDLAKLRGLRPMDDDFMRCIFKDNESLAQLLLRIILGKPDLIVNKVETQRDAKRLAGGRSVPLMYTPQIQKKRSTTLKSNGQIKVPESIGQDITPALWMLKT